MSELQKLADDLAQDVIAAMERMDDDKIYREISEVLEAGSSSAQEAFVAALRFRIAIARGRAHLERRLAQLDE